MPDDFNLYDYNDLLPISWSVTWILKHLAVEGLLALSQVDSLLRCTYAVGTGTWINFVSFSSLFSKNCGLRLTIFFHN